jgi:hypothetical protein
MNRKMLLLSAALLFSAALGTAAFSQGVPQTMALMKVDTASLATGYRTSKVVGSSVVNESGDTIGTIDDLIVTPADKVPFAVLSIGGFLGLGTTYVVISYSQLEVQDKRMLLRGATKDTLKALPVFHYAT